MLASSSLKSADLEAAYSDAFKKKGGQEAAGDAMAKFKELWPQVKQGLELLRQLSGIVPGVGSVVGVVIGIVIAAGDAASKAIS